MHMDCVDKYSSIIEPECLKPRPQDKEQKKKWNFGNEEQINFIENEQGMIVAFLLDDYNVTWRGYLYCLGSSKNVGIEGVAITCSFSRNSLESTFYYFWRSCREPSANQIRDYLVPHDVTLNDQMINFIILNTLFIVLIRC